MSWDSGWKNEENPEDLVCLKASEDIKEKKVCCFFQIPLWMNISPNILKQGRKKIILSIGFSRWIIKLLFQFRKSY